MIAAVDCYLPEYIEQLKCPSPVPSALNKFPPVYIHHRSATLTWLFDWAARLQVPSHCAQLATLLTDSFVAQRQVATCEVFRLIAGIALGIATKLEEMKYVSMEDIQNELRDCPLSVESLSKVELLMLETEHWSILRPTAASVSRLLLQVTCPKFDFEVVYRCSDAYAALIYSDLELLADLDAATVAITSVCAALEKMEQTDFRDGWFSRVSSLCDQQTIALLLLKVRKRVQALTSEDETASGSDSFEDN